MKDKVRCENVIHKIRSICFYRVSQKKVLTVGELWNKNYETDIQNCNVTLSTMGLFEFENFFGKIKHRTQIFKQVGQGPRSRLGWVGYSQPRPQGKISKITSI